MASSENIDIIVSVIDKASAEMANISAAIKGKLDDATASSQALAAGLLGAVAAAAAFTAVSVGKFTEVGDSLEKMSTRTGFSVEALSGLRVAAAGAGTSIETVEGAIKKMSMNMAEAEDGTTGLSGVFSKLGLDADTFEGQDLEGQFVGLANEIGKVEDPVRRTQLMIEAFGKSGAELIPLFNGGTASLGDFEQKAKDLNVLFTGESAEAAANLDDIFGELKFSLEGLQFEIGSRLAPYIKELAAGFFEWYESMGGIDGLIDKITGALQKMEPFIPAIAGGIIGGLVPALYAAAAGMWAFWAPLLPFILVGAALVVQVAFVVDMWIKSFKDLQAFWVSLQPTLLAVWDAIMAKFEDAKGAILAVLEALRAGSIAAWEVIEMVMTFAAALITGLVVAYFDSMGIDIIDVFFKTGETLAAWWETAKVLFETGLGFISGLWQTVWGAIVGFVQDRWLQLKTDFKANMDAITTIFSPWITRLQDGWKTMWAVVASAAVTAWDSAKNTVKGSINWIITRVNTLIDSINAIAKKGASVLGLGDAVPQMSKIPMLANGGIITASGQAIVGERGPELVSLPRGASVTPLTGAGLTIVINNPQVWSTDDIVEKIGNPLIQTLKQHMAIA